MLNHLPEDCIPYWDYDFVDGDEPRDASAGVISACGMMEMARELDDDDINKTIFQSAAVQILEATIDRCTDVKDEDDGLISHVTAALPQKLGIDQTAVYGDYFYLEALARYKNPDFKMYW
jgi:unsaturated chondroitin disaccharide hydrolase